MGEGLRTILIVAAVLLFLVGGSTLIGEYVPPSSRGFAAFLWIALVTAIWWFLETDK